MARKNLLDDLLPQKLSGDNSSAEALPAQVEHSSASFGQRGAIGAVSRSIERLKSQSVLEIDPDLVDAPIVSDRFQETEDQFSEFAEQIKKHGQQVPILVRPHPEHEGRFQIAYGRRRLRAARAAGRLVKATVRPLSDDELVVAQGQENSARKDLSYIEKALYAVQLEARGFSRATIMAALIVDKAALSHLVSTAQRIPDDIIRAIGAAPKAGRDRWVKLASRLESTNHAKKARQILQGELANLPSDERFSKLFELLASDRVQAPAPTIWKSIDGKPAASYREDGRALTLTFDKKIAPDFGSFVLAKLPDLYSSFLESGTGEDLVEQGD
jgi:ParB family transcriptional regulator, chromosome partitioning protein